MATLLHDIRFALRVLAKSPAFTLATVLVLALGIGLNTATFNALYVLALSPRRLPAAERLVQLYAQDKKEPSNFRGFSHGAWRELRERRDLFDGVFAQHLTLVAVGEGSDVRRMLADVVSANFFAVLGVPPARGRAFTAEEEVAGADVPVVVVSHLYWRTTGFKPDLVGSAVRVNGRLFTVVGIAPEGFTGTMAMVGADFYFPLGVFDSLARETKDGTRRVLAQADVFPLVVMARLQHGVSAEAARSVLGGVTAGLAQHFPGEYQDRALTLGPLPRFVETSPPLDGGVMAFMAVIVLGLTGTVLLIVSLNLASLLLARGHARRKEFAIRLALGGTGARLVRQLLTEGLVLAVAGGALGCVFALWVSHLVLVGISSRLPVELLLTAQTPLAVVVATFVLCTLATLFFALGPALTVARRDFLSDLQQNAGEDVTVRRRRWLPRHPLVVAQIALSLALTIGAGLFTRLTSHAIAGDTGIDADRTLVVEFDPSLSGHDRARSLEILRTVGERLSALPGVRAASIAQSTPYSLNGDNRSVRRAGTRPAPDARPAMPADGLAFNVPFNAVGADYFATLGLPLLRGRAFTRFETDHAGAPAVAIIDEALAQRLWPGEAALGRRIEWAWQDTTKTETIEIVGVTRTAPLELFQPAGGALYLPFAQAYAGNVHFLIRSASGGATTLEALRESVRRELQTAAPDVPFFKVHTFAEHKDASLETWALQRLSIVATAFGAGAALIAIIGLYGAKAYGVSRRTREIGIRLALGAEPARLRNLILREGLASALAGIGLGLLLGAALGRLLSSVIVDLRSFDPLVYGCAALALFAAAFATSWLPARQATKVNPLKALRTE